MVGICAIFFRNCYSKYIMPPKEIHIQYVQYITFGMVPYFEN